MSLTEASSTQNPTLAHPKDTVVTNNFRQEMHLVLIRAADGWLKICPYQQAQPNRIKDFLRLEQRSCFGKIHGMRQLGLTMEN